MDAQSTRRDFMKQAGLGLASIGLATQGASAVAASPARDYKISLAAWSLHKTIGTGEGKIPMLDMPKLARQEFDIEAIELVSQMFPARDKAYLDAFAKSADDHDVKMLLIMVDNEGEIAGDTEDKRQDAIRRHSEWIDIAADFGCHSIRMNWAGAPRDIVNDPTAVKAVIDRSVPAFRALCDYGDKKNINVIIENHGGASSHPAAMVQLMEAVDHDRFGTLPDFGNFPPEVDLYEAIDILMSYAKAVSAKCYDFDDTTGLETKLDFPRIISTVVDKHGYRGYIGIEFEGDRLSEFEGIKAAKRLLDTLRTPA